MSRQTSVQSYNAIKESGTLSELRFVVYEHLFHNGPLTAKQIHLSLSKNEENFGVYATRLSELKRIGLVSDVGTVTCEHTGRNVLLWDVTPNMPLTITKKEKIVKQIQAVEEKLIRLKTKLMEIK